MMSQMMNKKGFGHSLPATLQRQIRTEANTRFLRNLPAFHAEETLPPSMNEMLRRLDAAQKTRKN